MILFWNRKEVYMGYIGDDFYNIMGTLQHNKIKYTYRIINTGNKAGLGSQGEKQQYKQQCYVYVRKQDFELAEHLVNSNKK